MNTLLGPNGQPLTSKKSIEVTNRKAPAPATGEAFGAWAGRDVQYLTLPGGGVVQFDLSALALEDYRNMRDHYQVNASLSVLSFMQHQSDFHIECEREDIKLFVDEQIRKNWTGLNRAMAQSNWAGYSPSVLQWENEGSRIVLDKVKDLVPEECEIVWEKVDGYAPPGRVAPKLNVYNGIKQFGMPYPVPTENSLWYPLLMENGDYSGRKLLRSSFTSYFFSMLMHLFANRYFERFGEPTPVGRAPFDEDVTVDGKRMPGNQYMLTVLSNLRNRGAVVLPNEKSTYGRESQPDYDYDLEYLESQMRGADFERYLTRLDEEISIGLFTPILLLRTADVGSYNLGQGHLQIYLWMMNAMNDDRKGFLDKYVIDRLVDYNFGPNAPRARIVYRKLGNSDSTMIKEILTALTQRGRLDFDYEELGQIAGMTLREVQETTAPPPEPDSGDDDGSDDDSDPDSATARVTVSRPRAVATTVDETIKAIVNRVRNQAFKAHQAGEFGEKMTIAMGYKRRLVSVLESEGEAGAQSRVNEVYSYMDNWITTVLGFADEFPNPDSFADLFEATLRSRLQGQ